MSLFHQESAPSAEVVPDVLIIGETDVGKSSLVNLLAGEQLIPVNPVPGIGTLEATSYGITLQDRQGRDRHIRLFDTVGINEPHFENGDCLPAIEKANTLICQLQRTGGIHLLLFCIRAGRLTATMQNNFRLFSDILCRNKAPVALVATGLENEERMEDWWKNNESVLEAHGLTFVFHACVTTICGRSDHCVKNYHRSQMTMRAMLLAHVTGNFTPWQPQPQQIERRIRLLGRWLRWLKGGDRLEKELARQLQEKCKFKRSDAKRLAAKIWVERLKDSSPGQV